MTIICHEYKEEDTFSYTFKNIEQLKTEQLKTEQFSPPFFMGLFPWNIMIRPIEKALGFFLQCNAEDLSDWSCLASADLRLKSHKPGEEPFSRMRIKHLFYSHENDYGYSNFITWKELQDPENGYIHNGDITLEVHVVAEHFKVNYKN